jgi:hypothetical protein
MKESRVDSVDTSVFKQDKVPEGKPKITKILKKGEKVSDNTYKPPHKRVEDASTSITTANELEKSTSKAPTTRSFDKNIPVNHSELPDKRTEDSNIPNNPEPIKSLPCKEPKIPSSISSIKETGKPMKLIGIEDDIAERVLQGEITLELLELMAVAPAVKRILKRKLAIRNVKLKVRQDVVMVNNVLKFSDNDELYFDIEDLGLPMFTVLMQQIDDLPVNLIVHQDVVDQFLNERPEERGKKLIIVARPSDSLRVTYPRANDSEEMVECIMDSGSQIVSMDTRVATGLHLSWDPDVVIHMQSPNGNLTPTRGLARNVPFRFGDIVIHMQVHIADKCPYQVLVGRPFDVLCESNVKNTKAGDQFITINDPNSERRCTIATYPRGQKPMILPEPKESWIEAGPSNAGANKPTSNEQSVKADE